MKGTLAKGMLSKPLPKGLFEALPGESKPPLKKGRERSKTPLRKGEDQAKPPLKKGEESEDERWWPEKRLSISDPDWMWKMNRKWRAEIPGRNKAGRKVGKGTTSLKRQELRIGKERKTPAKEEEAKE